MLSRGVASVQRSSRSRRAEPFWRGEIGAAIFTRGHTTEPSMVSLLAFTPVLLPIPFGLYPNQADCERERAAFILQFADEMAANDITLVCPGPHTPAERRRFEFRTSPQ
jgi:hypothetical protein